MTYMTGEPDRLAASTSPFIYGTTPWAWGPPSLPVTNSLIMSMTSNAVFNSIVMSYGVPPYNLLRVEGGVPLFPATNFQPHRIGAAVLG